MDKPLDTIASRLLASGRITPADVLALRPLVWKDGLVRTPEAELLFRLNAACYGICPEWTEFFVEGATAHLLESGAERGTIDDAAAAWLIERIDQDGRVDQLGALMLVVGLLERTVQVPDRLKAYAIAQVERIVATGIGPTRMGAIVRAGSIDDAEATLLRRVFFAAGGHGATTVSQDEANALFRIKAATARGNNASSWERLFVQLIGNYLLAHQAQPVEVDRFLDDAAPGIGRFLSRLEAQFVGPQESAGQGAGSMTADEAHWLKLHIAADGELDALEKALLAFVVDESGPLPAELDDYAAKRA